MAKPKVLNASKQKAIDALKNNHVSKPPSSYKDNGVIRNTLDRITKHKERITYPGLTPSI